MKYIIRSFYVLLLLTLGVVGCCFCCSESGSKKTTPINVQIKNCDSLSSAVNEIDKSKYKIADNALVFFNKENDLIIKHDEYLVAKDNFINLTGIQIVGDNDIYNLKTLAEQYNYKLIDDEFDVILLRKFATKRLMLEAKNPNFDLHGAVEVSAFESFYLLQYETEVAASEAYDAYLNDENILNISEDSLCWNQSSFNVSNQVEPLNAQDDEVTWGARVMKAPEYKQYLDDILKANNGITELPEVVVAVIDSGIDTDHPWFENRLLTDETGKIVGKDYTGVNETGYAFEDDHGHGTLCAGIICHLTLPNVKILPIKTLYNQRWRASGDTSNSLAALDYIYDMRKKYNIVAVNMSFGSDVSLWAKYLFDFKIESAYAAGIFSVTSAGNDAIDAANQLPAFVDRAITVSALDPDLSFADYSNYGKSVDLCAPGSEIETALIGGYVITCYGTSMAAPHVAGYIALLRSNPICNYTMTELDDILTGKYSEHTILDLGAVGKDDQFGYGMPICDNLIPKYTTFNVISNGHGLTSPAGYQIYYENTPITLHFNPDENYQVNCIYLNDEKISIPFATSYPIKKLSGRDNVLKVEYKFTYKVNHYLEPIYNASFNEYQLVETETFFGEPGTLTNAYEKEYKGFNSLGVTQEVIKNNTSIDIYYQRNRYKVMLTVEQDGTTTSNQNLIMHGDNLHLNLTPQSGCKIKKLLCNGVEVTLDEFQYCIQNIDSNMEITIIYDTYSFEDMNLCDFTLCFGAGFFLVFILMKITKPRIKKSK